VVADLAQADHAVQAGTDEECKARPWRDQRVTRGRMPEVCKFTTWRRRSARRTWQVGANAASVWIGFGLLQVRLAAGRLRFEEDPAVSSGVVPANEAARLSAVRRYDILDTPPDGAFDRITAVAARLFGVPISIVSIVDTDRIWFKSHHGLDVEEIGRDPGLCASAILDNRPWVITDAKFDPRTLANPLVAGDFGLRFYAGSPLRTHDGFNLGTLCVIDHEPREMSAEEIATLTDLAAVVVDELELRLSARRTVQLESELRSHAESVAATLQESLIPPALPSIQGLDLASRYLVAQLDQVGGDFYDVVAAEWGPALVVGDACGKGTMAAATAGAARWTLHTVLLENGDPVAALRRLNDSLIRSQPEESRRYVTAAAAALQRNENGTEVTVALGGHPHPLIVRREGPVEQLGAPGPILGWFPDSRYESAATLLHSGDLLVMFTDGLIEAIAGHGETDDGPIRQILAPLARHSATEVANRLYDAIGTDRRDDAAFVVVHAL
jgi:sigma-B regulation protein RsbU (phosphoserine phosphatase)